MKKNLDIVVLGATGYAGKCTVKVLANLTKEKYGDITWGIAGRSKEKLVTELNQTVLNKDIRIMEADVENEDSLKKMLQEAKVVINCTGPNVLLSPKIVKVCIETGTHYVDISAEMLHILKLYRDYNEPAVKANVLIVPACGFSSLPVETAMIYLEKHFQGTIHTVECYTQIFFPRMLPGIALINRGSWTSLMYVMDTFKEHLALMRQIFPKPIEEEPEEIKKSFFHRHNGKIWFPYPGTEDSIVNMSQRYLYEQSHKKPIHYRTYTTVKYIFQFMVVPAIFLVYYLITFNWFKWLFVHYPRVFSLGYASEKGPSEKMRKGTKYLLTLIAKGWHSGADLKSKPTKTMLLKVSGQDPGYDTTAIAIIMSAITILKEGSNVPSGGVVMPGAAFYKTDIVNRLMQSGYKYEIVSK